MAMALRSLAGAQIEAIEAVAMASGSLALREAVEAALRTAVYRVCEPS